MTGAITVQRYHDGLAYRVILRRAGTHSTSSSTVVLEDNLPTEQIAHRLARLYRAAIAADVPEVIGQIAHLDDLDARARGAQ